MGNPGVRVVLKDGPDEAAEAFSQLPGVTGVRTAGDGAWVLDCERGADPREEVFRTAVERGWVILELAWERGATLEDIFVRLTTHDTAVGSREPVAAPEPPETPEPPQEVVS